MRGLGFLRELRDEYTKDDLGDVAAMMAYYAIFALFPMVVFVITIGLLIVPAQALVEGAAMLTRTMPGQVAALVQRQIEGAHAAAGGGLALGSAALALWGASRGSLSLGRALNRVHGLEETRPWWRLQLAGIGVTLLVAGLLILALALLVVGPIVGRAIADRLGLGAAFEVAWGLGRWVGAAALFLAIWSLLARTLPNGWRPRRLITPGAVIAVVGWVAVSLGFALYVRSFGSYDATYGALGAVMVFLTWLWLSNLVMLTGAEIDDVLERRARAAGPR